LVFHVSIPSRVAPVTNTIGEDSAILDKSEQLNAEAMFCIYEDRNGGSQLSFFEKDGEDLVDLNEAEEMLRSLKTDDLDEFNRIANIRDGIRSAKAVFSDAGTYVFCQAGKFQQLFYLDQRGEIISRDVPAILGKLKCSKIEPATVLPKTHNQNISKVLEIFKSEVTHRKAQQKYTLSLSVGQIYVLRELRAFYSTLDDSEQDLKKEISTLEEVFKKSITTAIRKNLNVIRRNGITGRNLCSHLSEIYHEHGMSQRDYEFKLDHNQEAEDHPRIVCSQSFI
jgi:hypothetical protein